MNDGCGSADPPSDNTAEAAPVRDMTAEAALVAATERHLRADGVTAFESTVRFYDALESAFLRAYRGTDEGVPSHLQAAVDEARAFTREDYADEPDADLREDVLATFYRYAAGFHSAYR